jgi:hypothetical protein
MGRWKGSVLPAELARARNRLRAWRRARNPKTRIPDRFWSLAVKLVATHGLNRTASALKLDYYALKRRVEATADTPCSPAAAFLELTPPIPMARECTMEFEDDSGSRTRIHLKGYDATDVVAVAHGFGNAS